MAEPRVAEAHPTGPAGYFFGDSLWVRAVLLVVAVMVTWHLLRLRTIRR